MTYAEWSIRSSDVVLNTGSCLNFFRSCPYFIRAATPSSYLPNEVSAYQGFIMQRICKKPRITNICCLPNGVKISAPSWKVQVFKNSKSPVAVKPVPFVTTLLSLAAKDAGDVSPEPLGYRAPWRCKICTWTISHPSGMSWFVFGRPNDGMEDHGDREPQ